MSIQFDENDSENDETSIVDSIVTGSLSRTLTPKGENNSNKKSTARTVSKMGSKSLKKNESDTDRQKSNRILYEKRLQSLESFANVLELPKFFTELLKQFLSDKPAFKNLKEVLFRSFLTELSKY